MSLFGSLVGDMEDDTFFSSHMRTMRQMNNMMNSLFADPFGMLAPPTQQQAIQHHQHHHRNSISNIHNTLMNFGMGGFGLPFNRIMSSSLDSLGDPHFGTAGHMGGTSFSSSTVVSMTSGPDGRPQVYKATSSTRTGPGGVKEVQRTVTDSVTGTKKMAIGHHIGERAHIIEREHNMHSGDQEERQDFINIEEDEAEEFNREWENKARRTEARNRNRHYVPAITASSRRHRDSRMLVSPRRGIRSLPALPAPSAASTSSSPSSMANRGPYQQPSPHASSHHHHVQRPRNKNVKTVSGSPPHHQTHTTDSD